MIHRLLRIHLEPIARADRRWRFHRALALGWLTVAAIGLICVFLHHSAGKISAWPFLVLLATALLWTITVWWRSRRSQPDYNLIAHTIEQENPELHAILLTAVEQQPDPATGQLNYLQTRVIRDALAQDQHSNWRRRAARQLRFARFSSAGSLALIVVVLAALYHVAPPRMENLGITHNDITVTPGDADVEKGASLVVLAKFTGEVPSEASLIVRPANEPERRLPLTKNLNDPVFGTSLPEVKNALTYRIEYSGGGTRDFHVSVFEFPRLERADAKITFPAYTGLAEKTIEDTRRISAVEGSDVAYTFHLNKPVASIRLVSKTDAPQIPFLQDTNRPNVYLSHFKLNASGRYELILTDEAGRTNKLPPQFVFVALTNRAPDLKFVSPRGDQRVSALEEIAFKAEASDDFGLKAYGLAYNLAGQETKTIALGTNAGPNEKRAFDYLVKLEDLGAQPDQLVSYYLWADDVGPDGNLRRTTSDMFFAEVRPFDEIFREGQAQDSNQQRQQGRQGGQNAAERLAELQKQIITATWNLQRRETGKTPTSSFKEDATTVKDSQEQALEQVQSRRENTDDPRSAATLDSVEKEMQKAAQQLANASEKNSVQPLPSALSSEQSAYQALLRLAAREIQVAQGQRQQGQNSRGARAQRQIDQLNLRQTENRYETERQAAPPQNEQQREQLQAFNRLKELAQRQQDMNERLRELQAALQEAKTEAEREAIRERLKRLQEEQQQMLADVDELRQRMDRPENQSQMSEARQQLEQTRNEVQRAADAMNRNEISQALSSGARAQEDFQQLRDDFRRQTSSQFADDMRQMRSQARELAQKEEEIGQKLDALNDANQPKTLTDSDERKELASQLDEQKKRLDDLMKHAGEVSDKAEPIEPLLAKQLYDTLRQTSQNDAKDLRDTTADLAAGGKLNRAVFQELNENKDRKAVEVAANLLRGGFPAEADDLEERARRSINELKDGVERAADSVIGDDTEALRLARAELDSLAQQIERELAQARNRQREQAGVSSSQTNSTPLIGGYAQPANTNAAPASGPARNQNNSAEDRLAQTGANAGRNGSQGGQRQSAPNQPGQSEPVGEQSGPAQQGGASQSERQVASANQTQRSGTQANNQRGANQRQGGRQRDAGQDSAQGTGGGNFLDQLGGVPEGGNFWGGPIAGTDYTQWSDRLRDVEEMLDQPELRSEVARIRDRSRTLRSDFKRSAAQPKWDLVQTQVAGPLIELRERVGEELARRETKDALVPIDRDPVPARYSELVRRYYEQLGKSESGTAQAK